MACILATSGCSPRDGRDKPPVVGDGVDVSQVFELRNLGLAHLENDDQLKAIPLLTELVELTKTDPFAAQNLAVAGIMALEKLDESRDPESVTIARNATQAGLTALASMQSGEDAVAFLNGRLKASSGQGQAAYDDYVKAAHAAEQNNDRQHAAAFWYAAYETVIESRLDKPASEHVALLTSAHELQPDNIFLLTELIRQTDSLSAENLAGLLKEMRQAVTPLQAGIVKRAGQRYDPIVFLDKADAVVAKGPPKAAAPLLNGLSQILRSQPIVRSDLGLLKPNLLEFARLDFQPEFYEGLKLPSARSPIGVELSAAWAEGIAPIKSTSKGSVLAFVSGDIDLDGSVDAFSVHYDEAAGKTALVSQGLANANSPTSPSFESEGHFTHALLVDLDNDFGSNPAANVNPEAGRSPCRTTDLDLVLAGPSGLALFRNEPKESGRAFVAIAREELPEVGVVTAIVPVDAEADGDLDLFLIEEQKTPRLLLNNGDGTFELASNAFLREASAGDVVKLLAVDIDHDVDVDIVALRASDPPVVVFENLRHREFRPRAVEFAFGPGVKMVDIAVVDSDENRSWDLIVTSDSAGKLMRSTTAAPGQWAVNEAINIPVSGRILLTDLNNDGREDIVTQSGGLLLGMGSSPGFAESASIDGLAASEVIASLDLDGNGSLDILASTDEGVVALNNDQTAIGNRANVTLLAEQIKGAEASASGRVNSYGLGSTLEMRFGSRVVSKVVDSQVTHFGLAETTEPDAIRIVWTNGIPSQIIGPQANSYICETQTLKGSCPYLYGWDGEKFAFVTDLLWAAPIGLQFADGVQAAPREWEHLFVPGRLMQQRDGKYEIRITEELWEAAYFDQVELTAVDHPVGTELVTNEKVGPPNIAAPRNFVFADSIRPSHVRAVYADGTQTDFTDLTAAVDGQFAVSHRVKLLQGLVEQYDLELEFAALKDVNAAEPLTLILTGWVRPSDTSINVALTANPNYDSPLPPQLLSQDTDGNWTIAREFMGFPGGKTKSIAVDVTGLLGDGRNRLRMRTSMEFAWDRIALVTGAADAETFVHSCPLESAELRYRGLSTRLNDDDGGPESYDYTTLDPTLEWPPMSGRFTRYGDVRDLLQSADDQLVVIGSGDEIAITFAGLPPVKEGWVRDFVLSNTGWDKDADLNTLFGDSSEPYPTLGVKNYPELHDFESRVDAEYQTRRQIPTP